MTIYTAADILTCIFEAFMMCILLDAFCRRKETMPKWVYGCSPFLLSILLYSCNLLFQYTFLNMTAMAFCVFLASFLFSARLLTRIFTAFAGLLFLAVIEIVVLFLLTFLLNTSVSVIVGTPSYRLLGMIFSKLLSFAVIKVLHIRMHSQEMRVDVSFWIFYFLIFLSTHLAVFLIFRLSYNLSGGFLHTLSVFGAFGLLFTTFFSLYLYEHTAKQAEIIYRKQQIEALMHAQEKHVAEIMVTQSAFRRFKHDLSHHYIALKEMLMQNHSADALTYIENLQSSVDAIHNHSVDTGNLALDAIINTKKAIAETRGISFTLNLQVPENLEMEPADICIIFGNALDNAIEACENVSKDKKIELTLLYEEHKLFCKITNSAQKNSQYPKTSKADTLNHGFGLQSIKTTVKKYNGIPIIEQKNMEFSIKFTIYFS